MPLLTVLYFYDVDIYEGEPAWASAWTLGWGPLPIPMPLSGAPMALEGA